MEIGAGGPSLVSVEARAAGRLSTSFILDVGDLGRGRSPLLDALLVAAVIEINVNRLNRDPHQQAAYAQLDSPPPDEMRRPVSINALANSLRLPFETVRRHIHKLADKGLIVCTAEGLFVPTSVVVSPQFVAAALARYERVFTFHDDLLAAGAVDPLPAPALPAQHPQAPVRAVGRILSDYFFRTLDALHQRVPDPLTAMVLLAIVRAGSEHIPHPQLTAALRLGGVEASQLTPPRVSQLSRRLGIPYETMRRHVGWLVEQGFCDRVGGGVLASSAYLGLASTKALTLENHANVRRMFRQIASLFEAIETAPAAALS